MKTDRRNGFALVGGTLLIAFGMLSLVSQLFPRVVNWSILWPFVVILLGGLFFAGMLIGGKSVSGLAIPGSIFTGIGLMLLVQNLTSHWDSWSYAWTLIILFVGTGIFIMGSYGGDEGQKKAGLRVMRTGFILFIIFAALFELIFSISQPSGVRGLIFPVLLILLGLYLIVQRFGLWRRGTKPRDGSTQTGDASSSEGRTK